jgi:hypothetical protein
MVFLRLVYVGARTGSQKRGAESPGSQERGAGSRELRVLGAKSQEPEARS